PEANAVVKLVNIDGIQGSERGSGFLRLTNPEGGIIDLKSVPVEGSDVSDYQTNESSVDAYFGDIDAQVAQTNQCLVSMYDPSLELSKKVELEERDGNLYASGFATDRPNVIDYSDIAGKTI